MKRSKFTDAQIAFVLKQAEEGTSVAEVCRKVGIADATFYNWRKKYAGMVTDRLKELERLQKKNEQLRKAVFDLTLDKLSLSESAKRNF